MAQAFGRTSLTFGRARMALDGFWARLRNDLEVCLKRDLWDGLLREAYGEDVGADSLFLQHTYLTMVVKAIAARVLDLPVGDPQALLSVPVFLGDAMQWSLRQYVGRADVLVTVPGDDRPLQIPAGFAEDQAVFEQGLDTLNQGLADGASPEAVGRALLRIEGAAPADADALVDTFAHLTPHHSIVILPRPPSTPRP